MAAIGEAVFAELPLAALFAWVAARHTLHAVLVLQRM